MTLVFFIHGVATRDVQYANELKYLIKNNFQQKRYPTPYFHSSFWGNVLNNKDRIWHSIEQDLSKLRNSYPQLDINNIFRYQESREGLISEFFGDILTYFNTERGKKIRQIIQYQLSEYIKEHSQSKDSLHIVAHSLGSVILWDILFSDRFSSEDPAWQIKDMFYFLSDRNSQTKFYLNSITTMGSPLLFFNMMLDIDPKKIYNFTQNYTVQPFRWINIIHASDIVAYPIRATLEVTSNSRFFIRDKYIMTDANIAEKTARALGQMEAASALAVADAHNWYWKSKRTANLITGNIIGDFSYLETEEYLNIEEKVTEINLISHTVTAWFNSKMKAEWFKK
jgi:hypothetical protein